MNSSEPQLAVLVGRQLVGIITGRTNLTYDFAYTQQWIAQNKPALSMSLPVTGSTIPQERARAYFGGLLPEGSSRRQIAERNNIDELDDVALLAHLGRECAGAITIVPIAADGTFDGLPAKRSTQWLNDTELIALVRSLRVPGPADPIDTYSVSLAGVQLKRGVLIDINTGEIGMPEGDELSSHILKLEPERYPGMAANEHCMQSLANDVELRASSTSLREVGDERVLLVERYDRVTTTAAGHPQRLHQEDMCQALGRLSSNKYERIIDGRASGPSVVDIIQLLRTNARPSIQQVDDFLRHFWFNVIIGNTDAHSKNYSVLYDRNMTSFNIAPLYDAICVTAFYANEPKEKRVKEEPLAMSVGSASRFWQLTHNDISAFANQLKIQPTFVVKQLQKMVTTIERAYEQRIDCNQDHAVTAHPILETVRAEIRDRCAFMASVLNSSKAAKI